MKTIKPADHFLFCKPIEEETKTASGLFLSTGGVQKDKMGQAEIINKGMSVKGYESGDKIVFRSYAAIEVELDRTNYLMLEDVDIIGELVEVVDAK